MICKHELMLRILEQEMLYDELDKRVEEIEEKLAKKTRKKNVKVSK